MIEVFYIQKGRKIRWNVLSAIEYASDKPGIGLVDRNSLLSPLGLAYHQCLLIDLLKVSIYVQGV